MQEKVAALWQRFMTWLQANAPEIAASCSEAEGATDEDFKSLEETIGVILPEDVKAMYRICNGSDGFIVFDGHDWLSVAGMASEWEIWKDLDSSGDFKDSHAEVVQARGIERVWWHPNWIPFTHDGGGNHLCIDLAPTIDGSSGQVITMWHDSGRRDLRGTSFADWFEQYIEGLEQGTYLFSADMDGIFHKDVI